LGLISRLKTVSSSIIAQPDPPNEKLTDSRE